jgi:hypothetical protein
VGVLSGENLIGFSCADHSLNYTRISLRSVAPCTFASSLFNVTKQHGKLRALVEAKYDQERTKTIQEVSRGTHVKQQICGLASPGSPI